MRAIGALADQGPPERVGPLLEAALAAPSVRVRVAAIDAMARVGHRAGLPALCELAFAARHDEVAAATARALGTLGDAHAEAALLGLLESGSSEVKVAAARTLGGLGTVRAVEPLLLHTEGFFAAADVRQAALDAVARIQQRLGPAEAGRLSIAAVADADGALSMARNGGALSLAGDEAAVVPATPQAPSGRKG